MIKPMKLKRGDVVAVVSPSGGAAYAFPRALDSGIKVLEEDFGLKVKIFPTVRMSREELYSAPEKRADDLNQAFSDPEVKGIISSIGGSDSVRILKYLDIDLIKKNPKLVMGYSDSTSFLAYLNQNGLVTYYGPSVMAGFAYLKNFPEALRETKDLLFEDKEYHLPAFSGWADEYVGWDDPEDLGKVKEIYRENTSHKWVNKGPAAKGKLWGGCLEILEMMNGSFAWPDEQFFREKILFIETSEEKPTPDHVAYVLRNFGLQGILNQITGLLVGKPKAYTPEEKLELESNIKKIVIDEWDRSDLNIVMNMDIGHTEPRHIMPYGIELKIDSEHEDLQFTESLFN